ncbi:MAG: response regulator [Bacilli bacterium]|nr:response regulator [Bacilli bacterium]
MIINTALPISNAIASILMDLIGMIILTVIFFCEKRRKTTANKIDSRYYYWIIWTIFTVLCADAISYGTSYFHNTTAKIINSIACYIFFVIGPTSTLGFLAYVDYKIFKNYKALRRRLIYYSVPCMIIFLFFTINLFTGFIYTIDNNNVYARTSDFWFLSSYIIAFTYVACGVSLVLFSSRNLYRKFAISLSFYAILPIIGALIQSLIVEISLIYLSYALSTLLIYESIQSEASKTIFFESEKNLKLQQEKNRIVNSLAQIYKICFLIDLKLNKISEIKFDDSKNTSSILPKGSGLQGLRIYIDSIAKVDEKAKMYDFVDFSTLASRIGEKEYIRKEFLNSMNQWISAQFFVSKRSEQGEVEQVLFACEDIDEEKSLQLSAESVNKSRLTLLGSISNAYHSMYILNFAKGTSEEIIRKDGNDGISLNSMRIRRIDESIEGWERKHITKESLEESRWFWDFSTIDERMKDRNIITTVVKTVQYGYLRLYILAYQRDEKGRLVAILWLTRQIDDEVKAEKEHQEALLKAKEEAEAANRAKSDFLSRMSHDIRTPLNGITGMTAIALKNSQDEKITDYLNKIAGSAQHLTSLVNDVLDLSRIESGKTEIINEPTSLEEMVNECISIIQGTIENRNLKFNITRQKLPYKHFMADSLHIRQVLINVLSNSVKFTPDQGSVTLKCAHGKINGNKLPISYEIIDTGIGMSEEFLQHIYEPFSQEKSGARSTYKGTGLGMAIAKQIVDLMGGTISITSKIGEGTTTKINLEVEVIGNEIDVSVDEPTNEIITLEGKRILVVDDNELNREISRYMLEDVGCIVEVANDGKEAVDMFSNSKLNYYDLILMDVMMPIMDGHQAAKEIRKLKRDDAKSIAIVAATANAFKEDVDAALASGMNAHIAKPINNEALLRIMKKLIK